jgi:site-specific recombinase XerD
MNGAEQQSDPLKAAIAYRDGLVIALLACRPIRRRNIAMIELGRHLVQAGSRWHLTFGSKETKNRQSYEATLPQHLTPCLERYLAEFRPRFPRAADHQGLWASAKGCAMTESALYATVCKRTETAFGKAINLHLFRDIAATEIAYAAPASIGIARDLLGHGDLRSIDRHYNQASQIEAGRAYQSVVLAGRSQPVRRRRREIDRS